MSLSLFAQTWDQLSELEKYAVAFSSNLFEINKENHFDFSNESNGEEGKEILKDSWGITDYRSLVDNFKTLEERGHSGAYDELVKLLDKHKKKSILEIAQASRRCLVDPFTSSISPSSFAISSLRSSSVIPHLRNITHAPPSRP